MADVVGVGLGPDQKSEFIEALDDRLAGVFPRQTIELTTVLVDRRDALQMKSLICRPASPKR